MVLVGFKDFMFHILENSKRRDTLEVKDEEYRQILIVVDSLAGFLSFEDARIIFLGEAEGYKHLAMKIRNHKFSVKNFKIVILLIGRGDVWETGNF